MAPVFMRRGRLEGTANAALVAGAESDNGDEDVPGSDTTQGGRRLADWWAKAVSERKGEHTGAAQT